jgi:hypothetical protein
MSPEDFSQCDDEDKLVRVPAARRPLARVLFEAELAHRVRAADNETDWEMWDLSDLEAAGLVRHRRAVRVVLVKMPPGEHFFPAGLPEWHPEFDEPGQWRGSILREWWARVRPADAPVDVAGIAERGNQSGRLAGLWAEAAGAFCRGVRQTKPVDLTSLMVQEAVERRLRKADRRLRRLGLVRGSADWEELMAEEEAKARGEAEAEVAEQAEERRKFQAADEAAEADWRRQQRRLRRERRARKAGGGLGEGRRPGQDQSAEASSEEASSEEASSLEASGEEARAC